MIYIKHPWILFSPKHSHKLLINYAAKNCGFREKIVKIGMKTNKVRN